MKKVLCLWYASESEKASIRDALPPGTEVVGAEGDYLSRFDCSYDDVAEHLPDVDAMIGFSVPPRLLEDAPNLKFFSWLHSGVDDLEQIGVLAHFRRNGIRIANIRGANAVAVAEQAMMFVLAQAKKTLLKDAAAREGRLLFPLYADEYRSSMLDGRTMAIIGVGSIGGRIAKHAKGFDMKVLGVRRKASEPAENFDAIHGMDELHDVLAQSDYVVLAAPSTTETYGMIGSAELAAMKSGSYLVNISRGGLVHEKAVYEVLTSGQLRGYAADVWWHYEYGRAFAIGLGSRLGVHRLPNVVASFDQSANADDVLERNIAWGTESLVEYASGQPLTREVDLGLGY